MSMQKEFLQYSENENLDFKEKLNLSNKDGQGKLLRTIIAIANSSEYQGYIIVGVDDNKNIVGVDDNYEEIIQQLCYEYITPAIKINYEEKKENNKNIAIIEISSTNKPFEFSKNISCYKKCDVYIRRGSTTRRASAKDIITVYKSVQIFKEVSQPDYLNNKSQLDYDISNNIHHINDLEIKEKEINSRIKLKEREIGSIELSDLWYFEGEEEDSDEEKKKKEIKKEKELSKAHAELKKLKEEHNSNKLEHEAVSRENKALMDYKYKRKKV